MDKILIVSIPTRYDPPFDQFLSAMVLVARSNRQWAPVQWSDLMQSVRTVAQFRQEQAPKSLDAIVEKMIGEGAIEVVQLPDGSLWIVPLPHLADIVHHQIATWTYC